ncbi:thioredoxin family protein [Pedobacter sp. GR22-6]|uniref:thioredoxin family protein n=1 Tax=Pedobacter sp. GR22-6 TaxID=3127957 RepID=UPI00307E0337
MKRILVIAVLLVSTVACAQNRAINFTTASLKEAFKLAKEQHKMIFTDCYTEWCGPCKGMDKLVFTQDSVADFFNSNFINVKMDMEKGEGPEAIKAYSVGAFPTYLLFDQDGKQIYKFVGGMTAAEFMAKIRNGMNPKNEIASREARYAAGDRDHALMTELIKQKFKQKEAVAGTAIANEYFKMLTAADKLKPENWFLFAEGYDSRYMSDIGSVNFNYLMANYKDFVASNGKEMVDDKINSVYKKLAGNCMVGYYFKGHPYVKAEFEGYKKLIKSSQYPDKKQLLALVDIAMAAGEKNVPAAGKLLAENVARFTQKNKDVVFDYTNFCATTDRTYPYIKEITEQVAKTSKNPYLINHCEGYVKRLAKEKTGKND